MQDRPTTPPDDRYARGSFTWRRMESWQIWALVAIFVVLVLALLFWW